MFSYSRILKDAYHITLGFPVLWLFGLFVLGGFNVNFLHFQDIHTKELIEHVQVKELLSYFINHPDILATVSFSILLLSVFGLVITNWCRIMLVLVVDDILKKKALDIRSQIVRSKFSVFPVIKMSLFTTFFICVVGAVLFLPPLFVVQDIQLRTILWSVGAVLFVPIVFTISCVNIFTTYFVILFKQKLSHALNLATDFFLSRWSQILGLAVALMAVYLLTFFVGVSIIYILKVVFRLIFEELTPYTIFSVSAIILIPNIVANILIWLLLAVLSVFFNTALLLLFLELITPIEFEEKLFQKAALAAPMPSS